MPGIDLLISRDLSKEIKKNLDQNVLKKIEKELFFEHGMSIKLSIEHFEKLHKILDNNSKNNLNHFEKNCIGKIIQVSKSDKNFKVKFINQNLSEKILNFYGDPECRKILQCIMGKKLTVSEILKKSKILKSPLYRKIENLLLDGIILESGKILKNTKRISQYSCIFDKINVLIENSKVVFEGIVDSKKFNQSSIAKMGLFEN